MNIILIVVACILMIMSILMFTKVGNYLVAGYNTSTSEEKDMVNIKNVKINLGILLNIGSIMIFIFGLLPKYDEKVFTLAIIIYAFIAIIDVLVINCSKKYKNK